MCEEFSAFRGARRINTLECFPLQYHKDEGQIRKDLIERGEKFVGLAGAHYKSHEGIAFYKKKKSIVKVNINGRIMVDPSTYRRHNPNYQASFIVPFQSRLELMILFFRSPPFVPKIMMSWIPPTVVRSRTTLTVILAMVARPYKTTRTWPSW